MNEEFKIGCPNCLSTQLTSNEKGYSALKGATGAILTGGIGLLAGFHGSGKVVITCLACGKKFKPGEGAKIQIEKENPAAKETGVYIPSTETKELNRIVCMKCKTENLTSWKYCWRCKNELDETNEKIHSVKNIPLQMCPSCKKLKINTNNPNYCGHCKFYSDPKTSLIILIIAVVIITLIIIVSVLDK